MTPTRLDGDAHARPGLDSDLDRYFSDERTHDRDGIDALIASSPDLGVRASAAAVTGFLAGLTALVASPFSLLLGLASGLAVLALLLSVLGLAKASRRAVAGTTLASLGLVAALGAGTVVGLRYAGIDTAVGDAVVPLLRELVVALNGLLPPLP